MSSANDDPRAARPELAPGPRLARAGCAWLLFFLATPGLVHPDGFLSLALVGFAVWAAVASRPGPRAFLVEWLAAAVGLSALVFWNVHVLWITLIGVALVPGAYMAFAGVVLRRLARVLPLALAAPAAWIGLETLNGIVEPPFGFGWMRFGHHAHDHAFLVGALRVVGVGGLGFALAALAGLAVDVVRARATRRALGRGPLVAAAIPALVVVVSSLATAPPSTVDGPRILLVQPAFEAKRKQRPPSPTVLYQETVALTERGLRAAQEAGTQPDLVVWGETVFPPELADPELLAAYDRGARSAPWGQWQIERRHIELMHAIERELVADHLFGGAGGPPVIPPGVLFATGATEYVEREGLLRRANAIVLFGEGGRRLGRGGKIHLVPGGESLAGLERIAWVRNTAYELAGYLPDLVADERAGVVALPLVDGRSVHVGLTICFDNTYDGPYTEPTRRGPLDFHLIASNEAWYVESWEFDQMIAFSRCLAAATGRSLVRATNSGISIVIGPDGRDVARLRGPSGKDRNEPGTLLATVPIPSPPAGPTPYARIEPWLRGAWVALPFALWLAVRRRPGYPVASAR